MTPFINYVVRGKIGDLLLGMTRTEILKLLGPPQKWIGQRPNIGYECDSYSQSDVWIYYGESVGVRFDDSSSAFEILIYPEKVGNCPDLFAHWPIRPQMTLGDLRDALLSNKIPFRESDPGSLNYWIIAGETCVAFGLPFKRGRKLHGYEQFLRFLGKYSSLELAMRDCQFLAMD